MADPVVTYAVLCWAFAALLIIPTAEAIELIRFLRRPR